MTTRAMHLLRILYLSMLETDEVGKNTDVISITISFSNKISMLKVLTQQTKLNTIGIAQGVAHCLKRCTLCNAKDILFAIQ